MTLRLTPDLLAAGYDFMRETPPFKGWRLPVSEDVGFQVVTDPKIQADFRVDGDMPIIRVSEAHHGHITTLLATLAHEMIHLRQHLKNDRETHGPRFQRTKNRICAQHGFDPKTF